MVRAVSLHGCGKAKAAWSAGQQLAVMGTQGKACTAGMHRRDAAALSAEVSLLCPDKGTSLSYASNWSTEWCGTSTCFHLHFHLVSSSTSTPPV